ncbi:Abi family protein [Streptococcus mutans]|uniref:Abi family protein n=1 Tax=Streptococcus mutans TaxID=1309 RepID=UPI001EECE69E|nr:Abi family protein [Streptococcus mutans]
MTKKSQKTSNELISMMKEVKGITFNYISDQDAANYLDYVNNYFRTACYRKSFEKYTSGERKGKYIELDFLHLQELSTLDMHLRHLISKMCLDIEHALKVYLVNFFDEGNVDEYDYVKKFLDESSNGYIKYNISRLRSNSYSSNLVNKYFSFRDKSLYKYDECPVWAFVEVLTFGDFVKFYFFCQKKLSKDKSDTNITIHTSDFLKKQNIINLVKSLRNACAHNNCLLENLRTDKAIIVPRVVKDKVHTISSISTSSRQKRLTVRPVLEFTSLVLLYSELVSEKVRTHRFQEMIDLFRGRMLEKKELLKANEKLVANYKFIEKNNRKYR